MPSQVQISEIGVRFVKEKKAAHLAAWTQAKAELTALLDAIVPAGGSTGQVLTKTGNANYQMAWGTGGGGGGSGGNPTEWQTPADFNAPPTGEDASQAVQDCINAVKGTTLQMRLQEDYYVNDLTCDDHIKINGPGRLVPFAEPTNPLLKISIPSPATANILSAATVSLDLSGGDAVNSTVTKLAVSSLSGFAVGQLVRIYSTDVNPRDIAGANYISEVNAIGYMATETGTPYIYLVSTLRNTYTTNPKISAYDTSGRTELHQFRFWADPADAFVNDWEFSFLQLEGIVNATVDGLGFDTVCGAAIDLRGCVLTRLINNNFFDGSNHGNAFGILEQGGDLNLVEANTAGRLTSLFSTGLLPTSASASNPWTYGGSFGSLVTSCTARSMGSSGFMFDSGAEYSLMSDNIAAQGFRGNTGFTSGFYLGGYRNALVNPRSHGYPYGVIAHNRLSGEGAGEHTVVNLTGDMAVAGIRCVPTARMKLRVTNGFMDLNGTSGMELGNVALNFNNPNMRFSGGTVNNRSMAKTISSSGGTELVVDGGYVDFSAGSGTTPKVIDQNGAGNSYKLNNLDVKSHSSAGWSGVLIGDGENVNAIFDIKADRSPSNADGTSSLGSGSTWAGRIRIDSGRSDDTAVLGKTSTGGNRTLNDHVNVNSEHVVLILNCTTANTTINAAEAATLKNQRISIVNRHGSTHDLIIKNLPASKLSTQSDRTLGPGAGATLVWNPVDNVFNLTGSPLAGGSGITGVDVTIDTVVIANDVTAVDFDGDDFQNDSGQVKVNTTTIPRNTWVADQNAADHTVSNIKLKASYDVEQTPSSSAGTLTIDYDNGNIVKTTQTENFSSIVLNNVPAGGWLELWITRTGSHTVTWPSSFRWVGNTAPTLSASGNTDKIYIAKRGSLYDANYELGYVTT